MHASSFVLALRDAHTHRALREYDHKKVGSHSSVRIPIGHGTEYEFLLKNQWFERTRVELSIDGTIVGSDFIIAGRSECTLERFLESDKRFKALTQDSEGVMDPTSKENGKITVRIWREQPVQPGITLTNWDHNSPYAPYHPYQPATWGDIVTSSYQHGAEHSMLRGMINEGHNGVTANYCASQTPMATGEGSVSGQTFHSTTWRGDATVSPLAIFEIQLTKAIAVSAAFCTECGASLETKDKFCSFCGTKR